MSRGAADSMVISNHRTGPREVIVIGVPTFGMVHVFFMQRYHDLRLPMNTIQKHIICIGKEVGCARNEIVAQALAIEDQDPTVRCSKIFFIDDDVLLHPDCLLKLLAHQRPIVSGLYYAKVSVPMPLVLRDEFAGVSTSWTPGDLVECAGHGMGICLIDADVFTRMRDELDLGVDAFGYPAWFKTTRDASVLGPAGERAISNQTEDMRFLGLAKQLGYQTAVDTSPQTFGWHLDTRTMQGYPLKQFDEWTRTGRITWETEKGPVVW